MAAKKTRTPQEKKELSYKKDRRNNYGESRVASVKGIRKRKRTTNRVLRRGSKRVTELSIISIVTDTDNKAIRKLGEMEIKKKRWKKSPDVPLGQYVKEQKEKAVKRTGRKKESKKNRNG